MTERSRYVAKKLFGIEFPPFKDKSMTEIPEDIMKAVRDELDFDRWAYEDKADYEAAYAAVAKLILAERERCAEPEDIRETAHELAWNCGWSYAEDFKRITNALVAERDRCARNEALLNEALELHQMIFDSFRGYIPDFEEAVVKLLRKAKEPG